MKKIVSYNSFVNQSTVILEDVTFENFNQNEKWLLIKYRGFRKVF